MRQSSIDKLRAKADAYDDLADLVVKALASRAPKRTIAQEIAKAIYSQPQDRTLGGSAVDLAERVTRDRAACNALIFGSQGINKGRDARQSIRERARKQRDEAEYDAVGRPTPRRIARLKKERDARERAAAKRRLNKE